MTLIDLITLPLPNPTYCRGHYWLKLYLDVVGLFSLKQQHFIRGLHACAGI